MYILLYIPKHAFDDERVILGIFSSREILKDMFYIKHDKTTMLYNLDNNSIETPNDNYYCYEKHNINEYVE